MDFENNNRNPRDRVDPEMLKKLLGDIDKNMNLFNGENNLLMPLPENRYMNNNENSMPNNQNMERGAMPNPNSCNKTIRPLAMVYSPYQQWCNIYDPSTAFERGTIFSELDFPFYQTICSKRK